jgi:hypothetical protein
MKLNYRTNTIYVKPYVKAYYENHDLSKRDLIMLEILLKSTDTSNDAIYVSKPTGKVEWRIPIPEYWHRRGMHTLTITNARLFASLLEENIRSIFEQSVLGLVNACNHTQVRVEIKNYLEKLKDDACLTDEVLSMDALKRHIGRFCKSRDIHFKDVKKATRVVLFNRINCVKNAPPAGYLYLEDWLSKTGLSRPTFYRTLAKDIPTQLYKGRLCVRSADVA